MKKSYVFLLMLMLCWLSAYVGRGQSLTATFNTAPDPMCVIPSVCPDFQVNVSGVVFVFTFTSDGEGGSFQHINTGGVGNGASMDLRSDEFNTATTERVTITRLDGGSFSFNSLYVDNLLSDLVTVQPFISSAPAATAQTVAKDISQTLSFAGVLASSIQITSNDFYFVSLDNFSTCVNPSSVSFTAGTVCLGEATQFVGSAVNVSSEATFEWDFNNDNVTDATTSTANTSYTYAAAGNYTAKLTVRQGDCSSSYQKEVIVNTSPTATISGGGPLCSGGSTTLSIALTGTAPWSITYTDGTSLVSQSNILTSPFTVTVSPSSNKTYLLIAVSDASCTGMVSGTAPVTVATPPSITGQPAGGAKCVGEPFSLSVSATGTSLSYQWKKNSVDISGADESTYSIASVSAEDAGSYTVEVSGACTPPALSGVAVLVVNQPPSITGQPVNAGVCSGETASFTVAADNATGYQWQVDQGAGFVNISNLPPYSGANTSTLTITGPATALNGNQYRAIVSGICVPAATSSAATLTIGQPTQLGAFTPLTGPVLVNTSVSISIGFSGDAPGTATWNWDDGSESNATVAGSTLTGSHIYATPGVYTPSITVSSCGVIVSSYYQYVVVYDPNGGFMTGSGWFNSPEGAYRPDLLATGRVNFGFVARYKKGATVPDGYTQLRYQTGNLNFQSTAYEWLVISGAKGQYKGSGTINGTGNYAFILTATDGGKRPDRMRMKIWDKVSGSVVYDNQFGASDTADPTTVITGGSIMIQKPGKNARENYEWDETVFLAGTGLAAFPNPFTDKVTIDLPGFEPGKIKLTITDQQGSSVYQQEVQVNKDRLTVELKLSGLKSGLYLLQATDQKNQQWIKLVKL